MSFTTTPSGHVRSSAWCAFQGQLPQGTTIAHLLHGLATKGRDGNLYICVRTDSKDDLTDRLVTWREQLGPSISVTWREEDQLIALTPYPKDLHLLFSPRYRLDRWNERWSVKFDPLYDVYLALQASGEIP